MTKKMKKLHYKIPLFICYSHYSKSLVREVQENLLGRKLHRYAYAEWLPVDYSKYLNFCAIGTSEEIQEKINQVIKKFKNIVFIVKDYVGPNMLKEWDLIKNTPKKLNVFLYVFQNENTGDVLKKLESSKIQPTCVDNSDQIVSHLMQNLLDPLISKDLDRIYAKAHKTKSKNDLALIKDQFKIFLEIIQSEYTTHPFGSIVERISSIIKVKEVALSMPQVPLCINDRLLLNRSARLKTLESIEKTVKI